MASVKQTIAPSHSFTIGSLYNRRRQIHAVYGGQMQGGISTPAGYPAIFLFTGNTGDRFGYEDKWSEDGVFRYVGEGQVGDMKFSGGNRAVRDHTKNGKDLLLFYSEGKGNPVRFVGTFACASWEYAKGRDRNDNVRQLIVFNLIAVEDNVGSSGLPEDTEKGKRMTLGELKAKALEAATEISEGRANQAKGVYYMRSSLVKSYVLARAGGKCEACGLPAPFVSLKNTPYLEPHHIRRVSDGGPDHPRWIAAVCPNCHREAHYGKLATELNRKLLAKLGGLEGEI